MQDNPSAAFADALARARQIAAKINNPTPENTAEAAALKRPFEENQPEAKKVAGIDDLFFSELSGGMEGRSAAAAAAAAAAAQINQKLGATTPSQPPLGGLGPNIGIGAVINEDWNVPDRMVGLNQMKFFFQEAVTITYNGSTYKKHCRQVKPYANRMEIMDDDDDEESNNLNNIVGKKETEIPDDAMDQLKNHMHQMKYVQKGARI